MKSKTGLLCGMENIKTSYIFEEGTVRGFDIKSRDRYVLAAMDIIESTVRSAIEENKISGRMELTITNGRIHLAYVGIQPFKFAATLIKLMNDYQ